MTGEQFGERIAQHMQLLGIAGARYSKESISKIEGGTRELTAEEAVVIAQLDQQARGTGWLVYGDRMIHYIRATAVTPVENPGAARQRSTGRAR